VMAIGSGASVGALAALGGVCEISEAALIIGAGISLPAFAIIAGIATLGLGIWGGRMLMRKGALILEEPKIRERLNKIMINAIAAYDKKEYQKFFEALSEPYEKDDNLLEFGELRIVIIPKHIIDTLIKHGFRSDGIAYLLNLIGEVLISGKIKLERQTTKDLKALAKIVFDEVLSEKLEQEAVKLDGRIHELRKSYQHLHLAALSKVRDFFSLEEYRDIAQENKDDARQMPFQSRLEEMRNSARINLAIFYIMDTGDEERELAIKTIKEIRNSINKNFQFVGTAKSRLEVLEDFLWVISGSELPEESTEISLTTYPKAIKSTQDIDNDEYFRYLNEKSQQTSSDQEKIWLYNELAAYYEQLAEKEDKINKLKGLCHWQAARKNYENARGIDYKNLNSVFEDYFKNSRSDESPVYNILSIDGGGIRGVLPALWLKEIEHRTHRPISHLFNMIAGSSTGGFTAAGLSMPFWQLSCRYSDFKPKFSASDILNVYQNESRKLFDIDNTGCYFNPKYTDKSRSKLFKDLFGGTTLSHALTKLIVPAVNEKDLAQPHLFMSYNDNAISDNDTFYDVLMATTASPTFFPPYKIRNKGFFLDGGVLINNPTITAYNEATRYNNVTVEKISILSLGTGCYTPDTLRPNLYRSKLFWQHNNHKVAISDSTDCQMHAKLGDRYQRWQVWFENPIELDDFENIPNLLEIGYQYIEELDDSDENPINKLVESLHKSQNVPNNFETSSIEITEITTTTTSV
ncbi:3889_t:CDS:2, partial [Scutellospora calospora]